MATSESTTANVKHDNPPTSAQRLNKRKLALLLVPALLIGFIISFVAAQQFGSDKKMNNAANKTIISVDLRKENKDPIDLLIKKGEYVQFNSKDGQQHRIVKAADEHDEGGAVDSGVFGADDGYLLQFNETGKFAFRDKLDQDYIITVLVYDPNKNPEDNKIKF